jgi:lipid-binding SYLF domain-containing protein
VRAEEACVTVPDKRPARRTTLASQAFYPEEDEEDMVKHAARVTTFCGLIFAVVTMLGSAPAIAGSAREIDAAVDAALKELYAANPDARALAKSTKAILVFPDVVKAGFIGGVQFGEGALRTGNRTVGYYNTTAGSYGFQAGVQRFSYALFFMTNSALDYLKSSQGWELGTGPSVVIVDSGAAKALSSTTLHKDVYAFFFDQTGLFAGVGLQGTKITQITP